MQPYFRIGALSPGGDGHPARVLPEALQDALGDRPGPSVAHGLAVDGGDRRHLLDEIAGVIALEAVGRRERPTRSRAMRSDEGWTQVPQVCRPVTESPELILLVHDARGRYCMW